MRINNYEQRTVDQVGRDIPGASDALNANNINRTSRFSLANIAAATSVNTDELMAVLDYRARRMAQKAKPAPQVRTVEIKPIIVEYDTIEARAELVV